MRIPKSLYTVQSRLETFFDRIVPNSVHPNTITLIGAVTNGIVLLVYAVDILSVEQLLWLLLLTQVFDIADGAIARKRKLTSVVGQRLDTAVDMLSGIALCVVLMLSIPTLSWLWVVLLSIVYCTRFIVVWQGRDVEWGGYKNALTVGFLCAYYFLFDWTLAVQVVAIFNVIALAQSIVNERHA